MSLPDFMIIGSMKCGTSTLQRQLVAQSGIFMTAPKEPSFFSDDRIYAKGFGWYSSLFSDAASGDLKGEASTHYTKLPTYPKTLDRMKAVLKSPKIIYIIRNPIERAMSHFIHEWTESRMDNDLIKALNTHPELVEYGRYAMQITPFINQFGAENVLLSSLEQLKSRPEDELQKIARFIGLEHTVRWDDGIGVQNVSSERTRRFLFQGLLIDNAPARMLRQTLIPKSVRNKIRQQRSIKKLPELPNELRNKLEKVFLKDRESLAKIFPAHPALSLCYPNAKTA
ncbi:MAG: sulfotransferase [Paracoccaceae bacterium]